MMEVEELPVVQAQINVVKVKEIVTVMLIVLVISCADKAMDMMITATMPLASPLIGIAAMILTKVLLN